LLEEIEVNESYFGVKRIKAKRARDAYGKTIVFGLLKPEAKVYIEIIPDVKAELLYGIKWIVLFM